MSKQRISHEFLLICKICMTWDMKNYWRKGSTPVVGKNKRRQQELVWTNLMVYMHECIKWNPSLLYTKSLKVKWKRIVFYYIRPIIVIQWLFRLLWWLVCTQIFPVRIDISLLSTQAGVGLWFCCIFWEHWMLLS